MAKWGSSTEWGFSWRWGSGDREWQEWEQGYRPKSKPDTRFLSYAKMADFGDISNATARANYRTALATDLSQEATNWNNGSGSNFIRTHSSSSSTTPSATTPLPAAHWGKFTRVSSYLDDGLCLEVLAELDLASIRDNSATGSNQVIAYVRIGNSTGSGHGLRNSELQLGLRRQTGPNRLSLQLDYAPTVGASPQLIPDSFFTAGKSKYVLFLSHKRNVAFPTASGGKALWLVEYGIINMTTGEIEKFTYRQMAGFNFEAAYDPGTYIDTYVRVDTPQSVATSNMRSYTHYDIRMVRFGTRFHPSEEVYSDWYELEYNDDYLGTRILERYTPPRTRIDFSAPGWPAGPAMLAAQAEAAAMRTHNLGALVSLASWSSNVDGIYGTSGTGQQAHMWFRAMPSTPVVTGLITTLCRRIIPGRETIKVKARALMSVTYTAAGSAGNVTVQFCSQAGFQSDGGNPGAETTPLRVVAEVTKQDDTGSHAPSWVEFYPIDIRVDSNRQSYFYLATNSGGVAAGTRWWIYAFIVEPYVESTSHPALEREE